MVFSWPVVIKLMTVRGGAGFGYAAWNVGILHGNVSLLAAASYFTRCSPRRWRRSCSAPPVVVVLAGRRDGVLGSLLCWYATRR
jgi:hypothetical protein